MSRGADAIGFLSNAVELELKQQGQWMPDGRWSNQLTRSQQPERSLDIGVGGVSVGRMSDGRKREDVGKDDVGRLGRLVLYGEN